MAHSYELQDKLTESWMKTRSSYDGPGKGKLLGDMSEKEHVDAINYHGTQMHQLKTGTHKYSKMYSKDQAQAQYKKHHELWLAHKDAYDAHTMKEEVELDEELTEETKHPAEDQVRAGLKAGYGDANYKSSATGATHKVSDMGNHFRSGMMKSKSLSGLLHLIDKKVNNKAAATRTMRFEEIELAEELTDKTIRSSDKNKVARVIADMLGVENAESMSPEAAINNGLRKIKNKRMTPELIGVLTKMLKLAQDVGVKVDTSLVPTAMKEELSSGWPNKGENETDILRLKDYLRLDAASKGKVGHSTHPVKTAGEDEEDQIRRMKVKYKTEEVEVVDEDMASADYKVNPETGRKYRAHRINFANSGAKGRPAQDDEDDNEENMKEQAVGYDTKDHTEKMAKATKKAQLILRQSKEREALATRHHSQKVALTREEADYEVLDLSDDELDALVDKVDFEDLIDVVDDEDLTIVDDETGEEVEDDEDEIDESALMEVLTRAERMKARIRFLRTKPLRQRRTAIALKRRSDSKTLTKRSRRLAIKMLKQRLVKKPISQMTVSEKERVEKMIQSRKALIDRLAMRLMPKVRKIESDRLSNAKKSPSSGVGM